MSSEERNTWVALLASLVVNLWFGWAVWDMYAQGIHLAGDGLQVWARTMLWVIPAAIVVNIGLTVGAAVVQAAVTGEQRVIFLKDERDRQFEFYGMGAMMFAVVLGFLAAMIGLAWGMSAFNAFNLIYLAFFLGDIANSGVKLGLYRWC